MYMNHNGVVAIRVGSGADRQSNDAEAVDGVYTRLEPCAIDGRSRSGAQLGRLSGAKS